MACTFSVDEILEDYEDLQSNMTDQPEVALESARQSSLTKDLHLMSPELVKEMCSSLASDFCLREDSKLSFCQAAEKEFTWQHLHFLNDCLVRRSRFSTSDAEKSWAKFHAACGSHMPALAEKMGLQPGDCFRLCLRVFNRLIQTNYQKQDTSTETTSTANTSLATADSASITETDRDILHYIGGSIIHSINKKISPNQPSNQSHHSVLQCFTCTEKSSGDAGKKTLTELLDRGGLTYIKPPVISFMERLELDFRTTFSHSSSSSISNIFVKNCLNNTVLTSAFYELCYDSDADDGDKELVLHRFVNLFFKIRMHHKCKTFMDEYRNQKQLTQKQKGLRKKLKTSADSVKMDF